jgi:predicted AlkP superfamily phosphohydrolase/phosphomutase
VIAVLQFDSACVALLERLLGDGRLPNLAALRRAGRHVELSTPAEDFAAGAFYSLYSGVELGDHGIFYPFQWDAASQRVRFATGFDAPPAVWERLAAAGLRTLAVDPYESRPPRDANGVFACGVGFADRVVLPRWSLPRAEGRRLRGELGPARDATEVFGRPTAEQLLALRKVMLAAPGRAAQAAIALLRRERFNLAWVTFAASHVAGHQFWDLSQLDGAAVSADERRTISSTLAEVYEAVDEGIGRVVAALPAGCDVIVTSAMGMDVNTSRADLLPEMLAAVLRGGPAPGGGGEAGAIWRLRAALPPSLRARIAGAMPDRLALAITSRLELRGLDWSRTRAFAHPADNQGYVRLNLRGRERDGIVDPPEAEALCEEIATGLATFRDPDGSAAVSEVVRAGERYDGSRSDRLPDLVVRWSDRPATGLEAVRSERFGEVRRHGGGSGRSGNHTPGDAWAVLVPGASVYVDSPRAPRLEDVAATVCEVTGAGTAGLPGEPLLAGATAQAERGRARSRANPTPVAS